MRGDWLALGTAAALAVAAAAARRGSRAIKTVPTPQGFQIQVGEYGLQLEIPANEVDELWEVFDAAGISKHFSENIVAVAREDGWPVGAIAVVQGDELSVAVHPDHQGQGLGTAMISQFVAKGGTGYMVAGTQAGGGFLHGLPGRMGGYPQQLDVPSWQALKQQEQRYQAQQRQNRQQKQRRKPKK